MNVLKALEPTGKVRRAIWNDGAYIKQDGNGRFIFWSPINKQFSPYNFPVILDNDWQPYHEKPEIRPENAGELWRGKSEAFLMTFYSFERDELCFITGNGIVHKCSSFSDYSEWARLYPPVEEVPDE